MQGFIIHITRVKEEDLIVTLLTDHSIKTTYRFYGARHSHVHLGYKIDFEVLGSLKSTIPQLRSVIHLSYPWNLDRSRMLFWQRFITLFYPHLRDIGLLDSFYYELLNESALIWHQQNPKRIAIEAYTKLLAYEGRLHEEQHCFACEKAIDEDFTLIRGFLPAHATCVSKKPLNLLHVKKLFETKSSIALDDDAVDILWNILEEGI